MISHRFKICNLFSNNSIWRNITLNTELLHLGAVVLCPTFLQLYARDLFSKVAQTYPENLVATYYFVHKQNPIDNEY